MEKKVIKRDGITIVPFDKKRIYNAIYKAMKYGSGCISEEIANQIANEIESESEEFNTVYNIQDSVVSKLSAKGLVNTSEAYYRFMKYKEDQRITNTTDLSIQELINLSNKDLIDENSNKNPKINSTQRDYMAGEVSKDISKRILLPPHIVQAHEEGIIHFHDADYFIMKEHNCDLLNLEDMLQNGTVISEVMIEKPHSFFTACNVTTQIIAQVASNQYGGQSFSLAHLAPFVDVSRKRLHNKVVEEFKACGCELNGFIIDTITEMRLKDEIKSGVQTIQYQILTLMTCNGQTPFVTMFAYLNEAKSEQEKKDLAMIIEEALHQRIQGVKNESGVWITPAFPKFIYVLEEDNIYEDSPYWYLTELAAKCTAKRMVPDYLSEKMMKKVKDGNCFTPMGCRSMLSPWKDENGNYKFYGRFNQGVVTLNLVDVALSSKKNMKQFWKILNERLELCHEALQLRHNRLKGTVSDVAPILWQHGALARLDKHETIDKLLYGGYSTISLGYAGLWECTKYMTGKPLSDEGLGEEFALEVMRTLNDACNTWKEAENIGYSVYGTPLESTTYKFASCLKKRFGTITGVTDKNYVTNSYHVHVTEEIDAFTKLRIESKFQELSPGGAISYVEVPNLQNNILAVLEVMKFIYNNIMYAELNTKSDYCSVCGYEGEIEIVDVDGTLDWRCPECGNMDHDKMSVARRTCGLN